MKVDRDSAKSWSEIAKNVMHIVGVFVAAYWTVFLYGEKEKPSLESRARVTYDLRWENASYPDTCKAIFRVDIENTGASSFDVSKVHLRVWSFERTQQKSSSPIYFDLTEIQQNGKLAFEKVYQKSDGAIPFIRHFPPQYSTGHSFEWTFNREPNEWLFFRVDFYKRGEEDQPEWYAGTWDMVCSDKSIRSP